MKWIVATVCGIVVTAGFVLAQQKDAAPAKPAGAKPASIQERASYVLGLNVGQRLQSQGIEIDADAFVLGLRDSLAGRESQLSDDEIEAAMRAFQKELQRRQAQKAIDADPELKALAEKNRKEGKAFLEANADKDGVQTTKSGLQYKVLTPGTGKSPRASDTVKTHYHGTLIDGTVFDSSVDRGKPISFPVDGVIDGWTEALQMMKVGGKWKLFIPSELAYGLSPRPGGKIGPNAVLVFEVELLEIVDKPEE